MKMKMAAQMWKWKLNEARASKQPEIKLLYSHNRIIVPTMKRRQRRTATRSPTTQHQQQWQQHKESKKRKKCGESSAKSKWNKTPACQTARQGHTDLLAAMAATGATLHPLRGGPHLMCSYLRAERGDGDGTGNRNRQWYMWAVSAC